MLSQPWRKLLLGGSLSSIACLIAYLRLIVAYPGLGDLKALNLALSPPFTDPDHSRIFL